MNSQLTLIRFLVHPAGSKGAKTAAVADDDAAEGAAHVDQPKGGKRGKKKEKSRGQNTNRNFGASRDEVGLCASRANSPEFSPGECCFGDSCKFEHDLRKYLKDWKREDLTTFGGVCPIWYVDSDQIIPIPYYTSRRKSCFRSKGLCLPLQILLIQRALKKYCFGSKRPCLPSQSCLITRFSIEKES